jgi:hypothetical protein
MKNQLILNRKNPEIDVVWSEEISEKDAWNLTDIYRLCRSVAEVLPGLICSVRLLFSVLYSWSAMLAWVGAYVHSIALHEYSTEKT